MKKQIMSLISLVAVLMFFSPMTMAEPVGVGVDSATLDQTDKLMTTTDQRITAATVDESATIDNYRSPGRPLEKFSRDDSPATTHGRNPYAIVITA